MKSNSKLPADTVKIVRHKVHKSNMLDNRGSDGTSAIYSNHMTSYAETFRLVEYEYEEEIDSIIEPQTPKIDTANKHIKIVPQINPNGEISYLYLNSNNDTILVDKLVVDNAPKEMPMAKEIYASDTIQPSDYKFGNLQSVSLILPEKNNYTPHKTTNDDVAQIVYLPLMVLITVAYLHRCLTNGAWTKLGNELKSAWVG